ncbi:hypothetical protein FGO68_gene5988 [Halteria grandinella]|uniref:Uncharacterized protein n=1 Tax=Halteria grandinella TaxID=5974 RepID=A0A8J8P589_HALGN|nr:hypothetical protein FGO68_gene5988 [Halteria grandinella]
MDIFLDEMRNQFLSANSGNAIPQSILFQQTRLMEKQVQVLEQNQKSMTEVLSNVFNQNATGPSTAQNVRQQIFHENRTMMLQMMAPMNQQLNEMKLLYENSKAASGDIGGKIDELKRVLAMQGEMYLRGGNASQQSTNIFQQNEIIDPNIVKKGVEELREQMKDMQREAMLIEGDMEKRFQAMTMKTQQQRHLPASITEEYDTLYDQVQKKSGITHTREVVMERLGGYFDYAQFGEELRQIMVQKEALDREFRSGALEVPEYQKGQKIPDYDFSSSIFTKDLFSPSQPQTAVIPEKMSNQRPAYLDTIQTEPVYKVDLEAFRSEGISQQKTIVDDIQPPVQRVVMPQPVSAQPKAAAGPSRPSVTQKPVNDKIAQRSPLKSNDDSDFSDEPLPAKKQPKQPTPKKQPAKPLPDKGEQIKNLDLFTLKKQVIEELKSEINIRKSLQTPFEANQAHAQNEVQPQPSVVIQGKKEPQIQEKDEMAEIMNRMRQVQAEIETHTSVPQSLRQSQESNRLPLSETMIVDAVAEAFLKEIQGASVRNSVQSLNEGQNPMLENSMEYRRLGEEVILEKLQGIFDDLAPPHEVKKPFEIINSIPISHSKPDVQVLTQETVQMAPQVIQQPQIIMQAPQPQQPPVIIPIVLNADSKIQNNPQLDSVFKNQGQLRDMISQVISSQLQMHNIKQANTGNRARVDIDEYDDDFEGEDVKKKEVDLNLTSRTVQEEEARTKAEQMETKKQMFINVQPYVAQTLNMGLPGGYSNPFSFTKGKQPNTLQAAPLLDLDNFDLSSHADYSDQSSDYHFKSIDERKPKQRYTTNASEGEIGAAVDSSVDEISLGEIRFPTTANITKHTTKQKRANPPAGTFTRDLSSGISRMAGGISYPSTQMRPLGETINYEEDKEVSPEKDDEKPIYESSEGPIPRPKLNKVGGVTGKSGNNMLNSGESFGVMGRGFNAMKSSGGNYLRETIKDDFLNENEDEDELQSIHSAESGEMMYSGARKGGNNSRPGTGAKK